MNTTVIRSVCFCLASFFASLNASPHIVDLSKTNLETIPFYNTVDWDFVDSKCKPFNYALEFAPYFNNLKNQFKIERAVETGTWQAETTICLGLLFEKVHSMEIQVDVFHSSLERLKPYSNVVLHYGNSPDILRQILPELKGKRTLFYLDAHWFSNWPLLEELDVISQTHYDNCIVVIDDFKVPGRDDIFYDSYGENECSFEYIKSSLKKIYSSYEYYYIIPSNLNARAKFVAIPKKWVNEAL